MIKGISKSIAKGAGKVLVGSLIYIVGRTTYRLIEPIADREKRNLYKYVYGEELNPPRRTVK